jgi:hypothetical protein
MNKDLQDLQNNRLCYKLEAKTGASQINGKPNIWETCPNVWQKQTAYLFRSRAEIAQTETPHYQYYCLLVGGDKESKEARSGLFTNGCAKSSEAVGRSSGSTLTHWPIKS